MKKRGLFVLLFLCIDLLLSAKPDDKDSLLYLPESRLFPVIFLDPLECQANGGSYFLGQKESDLSFYSVVNLGFNKPVIAKHSQALSWEMNLGTAVFSQFDLVKRSDGTFLAGLLSSDFKLSGDLSLRKGKNVMRFRFFHVSSHLGDDYLDRNQDTVNNDKTVHYEQADMTYLRSAGTSYFYFGVGAIITKYVFRERFSFQGGGLMDFQSSGPFNLFGSLNVNVLAENEFIPDVRTAFGVSFSRRHESVLRIWLEYYNGQLPYSTLDYGRVSWIGMALWIKLF